MVPEISMAAVISNEPRRSVLSIINLPCLSPKYANPQGGFSSAKSRLNSASAFFIKAYLADCLTGFAMTDDIDQVLISALMEDSRRSLKALAQISGLSSPSVAERLRRLEERGVLKGYTVEIDPKCFGYQLQAIVRIRPLPGQLQEVERQIQAIPEFTECDKVTGDDCFIARLHVRSMEQLDTLLDRLNSHAETNTAIVKKTPVKRRLPPMA
jgi:Lrp/AsnC family leucine-responsive transcriptional regulator